jgi:uncharacterized protein YbjT (DUF2867 family)
VTLFAVTGGTGFIGAALIDQLLNDGVRVRALARDPRRLRRASEIDTVEGSLENEKALAALADGADALLHLAGETHAKTEQD